MRSCNLEIGDKVLIRNCKISGKYDPFYLPRKLQVSDIPETGTFISTFTNRQKLDDRKKKWKNIKLIYGKKLLIIFLKC